MTDKQSDLNRAEPFPAGDYAVGYRKPPVAHRFKKGNRASADGKQKVKACESAIPQLPMGTFDEMLMLEVNRMVRIKAGDHMVEIPGIQAAFRALTMRAAKGDRLAVAALARLMLRSETRAPAGRGSAATASRGPTSRRSSKRVAQP